MRGSWTGAGIVGIMDMDPTGSTGGLKDSLSSRYLCSVLWLTTEFKLKMNACLGKPAASQACEHKHTNPLPRAAGKALELEAPNQHRRAGSDLVLALSDSSSCPCPRRERLPALPSPSSCWQVLPTEPELALFPERNP